MESSGFFRHFDVTIHKIKMGYSFFKENPVFHTKYPFQNDIFSMKAFFLIVCNRQLSPILFVRFCELETGYSFYKIKAPAHLPVLFIL